MTARYVIARGCLPDEGFDQLAPMAARLLELLDEAGHGARSFKLRDCNAARTHEPSGPCVSVIVLDEAGGHLDYGFAWLFAPYTADMRERVAGALEQARPAAFVARFTPSTCADRQAPAAPTRRKRRAA